MSKSTNISRNNVLKIYTDGASRGNPGPSAIGFLFRVDDIELYKNSRFVGRKTSNEAEYLAIINALIEAQHYTIGNVKIYSDSELVINQINGDYKIRKSHLSKLCKDVNKNKRFFTSVTFSCVSRENPFIKVVDNFCNKCLSEHTG